MTISQETEQSIVAALEFGIDSALINPADEYTISLLAEVLALILNRSLKQSYVQEEAVGVAQEIVAELKKQTAEQPDLKERIDIGFTISEINNTAPHAVLTFLRTNEAHKPKYKASITIPQQQPASV
jgi:GAF domain-containing protein